MIKLLTLVLACLAWTANAQVQYVFAAKDAAELVRLNPLSYRLVALTNGSTFRYDAGSSATTNTTSVFKPVSANGRWLRVISDTVADLAGKMDATNGTGRNLVL
ncbi:MAG TPA: hypothetical protein VHO25_11295, partial [Polyangiaceae bacterium]|nr:hypothetical protein [Polyangiaceae bacterium]